MTLELTAEEQAENDWRIAHDQPPIPDCSLFVERIARAVAYVQAEHWGAVPVYVNRAGAALIREELQRHAPYMLEGPYSATAAIFGHPLYVTNDPRPEAVYVIINPAL